MELDEYLGIIRRQIWVIVAIIVLGTAISAAIAARQPKRFTAIATTTFVKNVEKQAVDNNGTAYRYDNYYALQANDLYGNMSATWLEDPAAIASIYATAGVAIPNKSIARYNRLIKTKDLSSGVIMVTSDATSIRDAEALAAGTTRFIATRIESLISEGVLDPVKVIESQPVSESQKNQTLIVTLIGTVIGTILGLMLGFYREAKK